MIQARLQFILRLCIFITRTRQWGNLLRLLIWAIKTKQSWDEFVKRVRGEYYAKQVKEAVARYKRLHPELFKINLENAPEFKKWCEANPE